MATYTVKPLPESQQTKANKWQLQKSGKRVDTGPYKQAMVKRAIRMASSSDTLKKVTTTGSVTTEKFGESAKY